jgi:hypothetical protein
MGAGRPSASATQHSTIAEAGGWPNVTMETAFSYDCASQHLHLHASVVAPNNGKAVTQQCLSQYNNSSAGKVVQFFSLYHLATNFNSAWAEWTVLPALKFLSLKGLDMASQAVGNTQFLSVTGGASTNILSPTAGLIQGGEKLAGAVAGPGIAAATGLDVIANAGCGTIGRQAAGQMTPLPPGVQVSF